MSGTSITTLQRLGLVLQWRSRPTHTVFRGRGTFVECGTLEHRATVSHRRRGRVRNRSKETSFKGFVYRIICGEQIWEGVWIVSRASASLALGSPTKIRVGSIETSLEVTNKLDFKVFWSLQWNLWTAFPEKGVSCAQSVICLPYYLWWTNLDW